MGSLGGVLGCCLVDMGVELVNVWRGEGVGRIVDEEGYGDGGGGY